jgi:hypothetical protein
VVASELAWDAILSTVPELPEPPKPAQMLSSQADLQKYVGDYEFTDFSRVSIKIEDGSLVIMHGGMNQVYFWEPKHRLVEAEDGSFIIDLPSKDVIRYNSASGNITGLTLNPGPWAINADKTK